ncbi:MAG: fold metallo-hydrolase [Chloroflexi bacterium]|jgi:glyoxylase-like metal-dependent hydrolase (beta-lactamase superfamily II)|nr:fold metallo-hydrolase [Chloroflexota bacterium]
MADYNRSILNPIRREQSEGQVFYHQTHIANPSQPLSAATKLDLGGLEVEISLTPSPTTTNLSVYVPSEGVVYCGDCLVSYYIPNLEGGSMDDWRHWEQSLNRLEALAPVAIVRDMARSCKDRRLTRKLPGCARY